MPDKNKKKGKFLDKFLTQNEHVVAVDVGSRYVKIAAAHKRKNVIENTILDAELIPYLSARGDISPEQVSKALAAVLERNNIKNASFISMLPLEFVSIKRFEVPSVSAKQIKQIVPFEAEKHLPFSVDRAVIDFDFMSLGESNSLPDDNDDIPNPTSEKAIEAKKAAEALETAGNKSVVTLAAVRKAIIPKFLELCNVKGCRQSAIDVTAFALYNSLSFFLRKNPLPPDSGDVILIDLGARRSEMIVTSSKTEELLFTRSISFGGDEITNAIATALNVPFEEAERIKCNEWKKSGINPDTEEYNDIFEPLISQLEKSLRYIKKSGLSTEQNLIYLSGGASAIPGIIEFFQLKFGLNVKLFNPLPLVNAPKTKVAPQIFTSVIGAALRMINEAKLKVDLLPVDITKLQQLAIRKKRFIQLGIVAAVILAILLSIFGVKVLITDLSRRKLKAEYLKLVPEALKVDSLEKRNEILRIAVSKMEGLTDRKTSWSSVLKTLSDSMSSNIWVNKLSVDKKNYLTIDAYSIGNDYINFKNKLIASIRFDDVQIVNEQNDRSGKSKIFKLRCKVIPDYKFTEEFNDLREKLLEKLHSLNSDNTKNNEISEENNETSVAITNNPEKKAGIPETKTQVNAFKPVKTPTVIPPEEKERPKAANPAADLMPFNKNSFLQISNQLEKSKTILKNGTGMINEKIKELPPALQKLILEKQKKNKLKTIKNNERR
ncbi:MAG: hypothetical protein DRI44_06405 [Chlamydiae bacterium]|nr:MAG: hypothetical protein DRI44_06405 [Chlamydiota bacterium]